MNLLLQYMFFHNCHLFMGLLSLLHGICVFCLLLHVRFSVKSIFSLHFRFCKNLSADKINLSAFKGEGELNNLELDEIVLTDLLELPSWLRLTSAWCNKVTFRIQWTKLKSVPIFLVSKWNIFQNSNRSLHSYPCNQRTVTFHFISDWTKFT